MDSHNTSPYEPPFELLAALREFDILINKVSQITKPEPRQSEQLGRTLAIALVTNSNFFTKRSG